MYRIVRLLGQGGMGAVYEVVHEKLGVHYALKTFTLDHGHVELLKERFLAEGRILARLHHPSLVRVFDLDVDSATQTIFFVMDLVLYKDGEPYTLADVEDGSADEEHLARWFGQLASALDYIHNEGIVHRDIKLNNILLDARGGVVLSDFGVSRFCSGQLRKDLHLDRTIVSGEATTGTLIMGTAGYMAPEVKRGEDASAGAILQAAFVPRDGHIACRRFFRKHGCQAEAASQAQSRVDCRSGGRAGGGRRRSAVPAQAKASRRAG